MKRLVLSLSLLLITIILTGQIKRENSPPTNLRNGSDYLPMHVDLLWTPPEDWEPSRVDRWFEYDRGIYTDNALGSCPGCPVEIAIRWDSNYFDNYYAVYLTKIRYVLREAELDYALRVYQYQDGTFDTLFDYPLQNNLEYYKFDTTEFCPITIDKSKELWVGLWVSDLGPGFPLAMGFGPYPLLEGYGNMIKLNPAGPWQRLTEINPDFRYSWQIGAYIETPYDIVSYPVFNVYRSIDDQPFEKIHEGDVYDTIYHDDIDIPAEFVIKYYVSSVYEDGSTVSSDTMKIWLVEIPENSKNDEILAYPNPTSDVVTIRTTGTMVNYVSLINSDGEIVLTKTVEDEKTILDVSHLSGSIYFIKAYSPQGVYTSKLLIIK